MANKFERLYLMKEFSDEWMKAFSDERAKSGYVFECLYREYKEARNNENDVLDIHGCDIRERVEEIVKCLKENDINMFTISSTCGSIEDMMTLEKAGCKMVGLVEINGSKAPWESENKKLPAVAFEIA